MNHYRLLQAQTNATTSRKLGRIGAKKIFPEFDRKKIDAESSQSDSLATSSAPTNFRAIPGARNLLFLRFRHVHDTTFSEPYRHQA
jgi:hypothetical protein